MKSISTKGAFEAVREEFVLWLQAAGSEEVPVTNEFEVIRFKTKTGVGIIYCNKTGKLTSFAKGAETALRMFESDAEWHKARKAKPAEPPKVKPKITPTAVSGRRYLAKRRILQIAARDGWTCIYCDQPLDPLSATEEHFLARSHGGDHNINNLGLACQPCNSEVGSLPIVKKILFAIAKRAQKEAKCFETT